MKEISFEIKIPKFEFSGQRKFQFKMTLSLLIIIGAFTVRQYFDFTFVGTLILAYFWISLLWGFSSRIAASLALFFLVCTPLLLILKNAALAETFAIYAYYFLIITVIGEIVALKRENKVSSEALD